MHLVEKAESLLSEGYAATGAQPVGGFLDILLELALSLLKDCLPLNGGAAAMVARAKGDDRLLRVRTRAAVRGVLRDKYGLGGYAQHRGDQMAEAMLSAVAKADPVELDQFCRECCG